MKKSWIASIAAFACAAVIGAFALDRAGKISDIRIDAGVSEYSVTFDASDKTTVKAIGNSYAIGTTTAGGNKVGVVGHYSDEARITFNGVSFGELMLCEYDSLVEGDGYPFSTITGFAVSFSIEYEGEPEPFSVAFESMDTFIGPVESEKEYKGLSITPDHFPVFDAMVEEGDTITVSSLTIWYTC